MPLVSDTTSAGPAVAVALGAAVVALVALILALTAQRRLAAVRRDFRVLHGDGATDIARLAAAQTSRLDRLGADVAQLRSQLAGTQEDVRQSLRNVAVVRYDAFGDMGGRLSFSAAVVDDHGDGLVLSAIHARSESRTYAKGVVGGRSSIPLTPEEQQALAAAQREDPA
mgnify:CR=1 FL=1